MNKTHIQVIFIVVSLILVSSVSGALPLDTAMARNYFNEVSTACAKDHGKLWGLNMYGPLLLVDPATRSIVANQPDLENHLTAYGNGTYGGLLPKEVNISNTALEWGGVQWSMVRLPLPEDRNVRTALIIHELFHRVQNKLGFPVTGPANNHLDTKDGRIWLQLEWRALSSALKSKGSERKQAITDALLFRAHRRELFHTAMMEERALELHEGLAEYTGMKIGISTDTARISYTLWKIGEVVNGSTFVRSFAYASGPAYGLLCDLTGKKWIPKLKKYGEFGAVIQQLYGVKVPGNIKRFAIERGANYGLDSLTVAETTRDEEKKRLLTKFQARYIDGPVLSIPLRNMNMQFDPNSVQPFDTFGTVYSTIRITDDWGILTVSKGALMNPTFQKIVVSEPVPGTINSETPEGDGWKLELKSGWMLGENVRKGDYTLVRKPK